jgi:hypothetical protein
MDLVPSHNMIFTYEGEGGFLYLQMELSALQHRGPTFSTLDVAVLVYTVKLHLWQNSQT